ncbi:MAG: DEAD/DEAH box helicase family protein [Akkermansia sp.]
MIDRRLVTPDMFALFYLGICPYAWQIACMRAVWQRKKVALRAANGSGKTANVVAPLLLWFLWRYPRGRAVVTSGSWNQIATQLFHNLRLHKDRPCFAGWSFNKEQVSTPQGGFIVGISTNNPGRAEGYHESIAEPEESIGLYRDYVAKVRNFTRSLRGEAEQEEESPVMYIVDEAKTVPDPIFTAIDRCTITYRLYCSSPGACSGQFYRCFTREASSFVRIVAQAARPGPNGTVDYESTDCPHIKRSKVQDVVRRYGIDSPLTRSMVFAEFTGDGDSYVITPSELQYAIDHPPERTHGTTFGAMDFAAGGDESTTSVACGNWARCVEAFHEPNTVTARRRQVATLQKWGVREGNAIGDADGLGKPIVQDMQDEGYWVDEFHGGSPCEEDPNYANLISQAWIVTGLLIKKGLLDVSEMDRGLPGEGTLFDQLTSRKIEFDARGRCRIQPKDKMKKEGRRSPDRADSFCMAVWYNWHENGGWDTVHEAPEALQDSSETEEGDVFTVEF